MVVVVVYVRHSIRYVETENRDRGNWKKYEEQRGTAFQTAWNIGFWNLEAAEAGIDGWLVMLA